MKIYQCPMCRILIRENHLCAKHINDTTVLIADTNDHDLVVDLEQRITELETQHAADTDKLLTVSRMLNQIVEDQFDYCDKCTHFNTDNCAGCDDVKMFGKFELHPAIAIAKSSMKEGE